MYAKNENGITVLYPTNKENVLRSRITNNTFDFVFLSKNDPESNYVEESKVSESLNSIDNLELIRKNKLNDLDTKYKIIKTKIIQSSSIEELNDIKVFK